MITEKREILSNFRIAILYTFSIYRASAKQLKGLETKETFYTSRRLSRVSQPNVDVDGDEMSRCHTTTLMPS